MAMILLLLLVLHLFGKNPSHAFRFHQVALSSHHYHQRLTTTKHEPKSGIRRKQKTVLLSSADIENDDDSDFSCAPSSNTNTQVVRPRVNEVDFCMAPVDASMVAILSASSSPSSSIASGGGGTMTRYLNNASNRAIRRILLSKSWPSPESFNLSLRKSLSKSNQQQTQTKNDDDSKKKKIPSLKIPRLNIANNKPPKQQRSNEQYIQDQLSTFRSLYGSQDGNDDSYYAPAEAYLECVLSLATSGIESNRVQEVLQDGVPYQESYRRLILVLERVGIQLLEDDNGGRRKIAPQLVDGDICLSMLDKLSSKSASASSSNDNKNNSNSKTTGGILLSTDDDDSITVTRQLNILSNIVQRTLLFGGDDELLVVADTLEEDQTIFQSRYPSQGDAWAYYQVLIQLLRTAHKEGSISLNNNSDNNMARSLCNAYANAYDRLTAACVELGSGYFFSASSTADVSSSSSGESTNVDSSVNLAQVFSTESLPIPKSPVEELGRFATWESKVRGALSSDDTNQEKLPTDLVGTWQIQEDVGGQVLFPNQPSIRIQFKADGSVVFLNNDNNDTTIQGLTWRLDPGPTHLDTCRFQVLAGESLLLYRGFLDRGARLEARFSKRPLSIKGKVQLQLRRDSNNRQEALPINYQSMQLTNFVMTQMK
mmetsp:Transcript_24227/g.35895  ORF Transcript_24227/g.35895 Transcript_24227/m.35895 type:complete len:654 (-) Transcript_24227:84-2045(-)|eukprot:CAMPEP_0194214306 /NCGR_PEP_ID=MMETSP0156-20130528/15479_1 /TAXON_ID=33649 /ORGANISM="Thalassionema nitzschioides, Strain L26-B" /LENGTH=653 /DNA_ID=CAMNT_0038942535 /DNA_START=49 /DNA_END=2010 /DNA_ORIENTATION=+